MNKPMLQRLAFIDRRIREGMTAGQLANCATMAREYEVSRKSIQRDIDFLKNQYDAPIEYDGSRRGYYYREDNWRLPAVPLSESDLFAMSIARQGLAQYENTPVYDRLLTVFAKLEESLPDKVSVDPAWVADRISVIPDRLARLDPEVWSRVTDGLQRCRRLDFFYRKPGSDDEEERRVDPLHVTGYRGEWYLIAFCHSRQGVRIFALSRMTGVRVSDIAAGDHDFDYHAYMKDSFGIFRGTATHRVRLRFSPRQAAYVRERSWQDDQEVVELGDGGVELAFSVNHLGELCRWVLSWGGGVEVVAPMELRRMVIEEIEGALALYRRQGTARKRNKSDA